MKKYLPIIFILLFTHLNAQIYSRDYNWYTPFENSSDSLNIAHDPIHNRIFMSGMGSQIQQKWPSFTHLDLTTFSTVGNRLEINGEIVTAIPDGEGGYYIAGKFTKINGQQRTYLAQIDANNELTSFNPTITYFFPPNASINTLKIANNILFIGGGISTVNGQSRLNVAAFDILTGNLTSWAPNPNGVIKAIEFIDNKIILGGSFTMTSGVNRNNIASYDLNLNLTSWNPSPNGAVTLVKKGGGNIYISGYFTTFDLQPRVRLAEIDTSTMLLTSFDVAINSGYINVLLVDQNQLYIAGNMTNVDGVSTQNFAAIDLLTQSINPNLIQTNGMINSLVWNDGNLLLGGEFTVVNNESKKYFVEFNPITGVTNGHQLSLNNTIQTISRYGTGIILSGTFDVLKLFPSNHINCFNAHTGEIVNSPIQSNGPIHEMSIDGRYLSILGDFTQVNGLPRNKVAIFDLFGDSLLQFNLNENITIDLESCSIQISEEELYLETSIYGSDEIIAIPIFNGDSLRIVANASFDPNANFGGIYNFNIKDSLLLLTGIFNSVNGETRASFAIVNKNSGIVHPLDLGLTYQPYLVVSTHDAIIKGNTLYLAGQFDFSNNLPMEGVISVDINSGILSQIAPNYGNFIGLDLDLKHDILRIASEPQYFEYDLNTNAVYDTLIINNDHVVTIHHFGDKLFAYDELDFTVYNACDNISVLSVNVPCSYTWQGTTYIQSGFYAHEINNPLGCDSTAYLNLTILNSESYNPVHYCGSQFTSNNGSIYTQSGLYNEIYTNIYGCDSIARINLHIYPTYDTTISILNGSSSYFWADANETLTSTGVYQHVFQSINGCDSVINLDLNLILPINYTTSNPTELANGNMKGLFIDSINQVVLVGGSFSGFHQKGVLIQKLPNSENPEVLWSIDSVFSSNGYGGIERILSDENGGAYVIGGFTQIGDSLRSNICHVDSNFKVTAWNPNLTGLNLFLAAANADYLFLLSPNFPNDSIVKVNRLTGNVESLNLSISNMDNLYQIVATNDHVFLVGKFVSNGTYGIINYNLNTNTFQKISINSNSYVSKIHIDANKIYAIGGFTQIAGNSRNKLARLSFNSGNLSIDGWNPNQNGSYMSDVATTPSKVIVTGSFTTIGGQSRNGTASLNKNNSNASSFNPGINLGTIHLFQDKIGFYFDNTNVIIGSGTRDYFAAFDTATMILTNFDLHLKSFPQSPFDVINNELVAFNFDYVGFKNCQSLAYYDLNTDQRITGPIEFNYPYTQIQKIQKVGNTFYFYGNFYDSIAGGNVVVISYDGLTGNQVAMSDPIYSCSAMLNHKDGYLYFANAVVYSGNLLPSLSRLLVSSNTFDNSFNLNIITSNYSGTTAINDIEFQGNDMYISGGFTHIQGLERHGIAKLNSNTFQVDNFNPNFQINTNIEDIQLIHDDLYISGYFDTSNANQITHIGRINISLSQNMPWVEINNSSTAKYVYKNNFIYMYSNFLQVNAYNRKFFTVFPENSFYPLEIQYDEDLNPNAFINETVDLDVLDNDIFGIFSGLELDEYRVFRVCREDSTSIIDNATTTPFVWFGDSLTQTGVYYHNVVVPSFCDSLYILNYNIVPETTYDTVVIASCSSYTWIDGNTYSTSLNTPTWTLLNSLGGDSIVTLNLTILQPTYGIDALTVCDSLVWLDGITYYSNNTTATHIIPNAAGCDSIITLNLTILQPTYGIDTQTACDSLTWLDGITYYSNNAAATHIIPSSAGCDSIITLNVTILQPTYGTDVQNVCDSLAWIDGITYYSNNTTATYIIPNVAGCDSIITLNLTIIPAQPLTIENSFSLPSDANNCIGQAAITVSGNADFELNVDNGLQIVITSGYSVLDNLCPGVHDLKITDNCGDTLHATLLIPVDSNYVYNNPYLDSMAVDSLGATVSNCTIYYNSIDTAYIDSIWSVGNIVNVIWNIVDANGSNYDTSSYVLNNGNGVYLLQLSVFCPNKAFGDYFAVSQAIYFENGSVFITGIDEKDLHPISIHPNPTNDYISITSANHDIKRIIIYDLYGKELQNEVQNGNTYLINLNDKPAGIYLFNIITTKGEVTKRVVKQ